MAAGRTPTRARKSAGERREDILAVAIEQFAIGGYRGTSTEAIARDAGISQPYLFRLFHTKRELFLACHDRTREQMMEVFRQAAARAPAPEQRLHEMGRAYVDELLPDRHAILMQLQAYAASAEPGIQAHVRAAYGRTVAEITQLSGAAPEDVWNFCSHGMLLNVTAALDLASIADGDEWAAAWTDAGQITGYGHGEDC